MPGLSEEFGELPRLFRESWLKSVGVYTSGHPLLVFSFLSLTLTQVFVNYFFLQYFPAPILLTWFQVTGSLVFAYILGEFGSAFHSYRYFPRLKRAHFNLFIRYLPYSLSFLFFSVCSNLLITKLSNPIYIPITSSLSVGFHQVLALLGCPYSLSSPFLDVSHLKWISTVLLLLPSFVYCSCFSDFFFYSLLSAFATILFRALFLPKALHLLQDKRHGDGRVAPSSSADENAAAVRISQARDDGEEGGRGVGGGGGELQQQEEEGGRRGGEGEEEKEEGGYAKRREGGRGGGGGGGRETRRRTTRGGGSHGGSGTSGSVLNFYHNIAGCVFLLLPAWASDEFASFTPYLLSSTHAASSASLVSSSSSSFLFSSSLSALSASSPSLSFFSSVFEWFCERRHLELVGCCVCVGFLSFLKNVVGNRLMTDGGAYTWKSLEVVSLFLLFLLSFIFFSLSPSLTAMPSVVSMVVYFFVLTGRVLGTLADGLGKEEERKNQLRLSLLQHDHHSLHRAGYRPSVPPSSSSPPPAYYNLAIDEEDGEAREEEEEAAGRGRPRGRDDLDLETRHVGRGRSFDSSSSSSVSSYAYPPSSSSGWSPSSSGFRKKAKEDLSDEPVLFIHSDGPATSFRQGSPEDAWADEEEEEEEERRMYDERRSQLIAIVQAYVTRTFDEDLELIESIGGVKAIADGLDSNLTDGLPIAPSASSGLLGAGTPRQHLSKITTFLSNQLGSLIHGSAEEKKKSSSSASFRHEREKGDEELQRLFSSHTQQEGEQDDVGEREGREDRRRGQMSSGKKGDEEEGNAGIELSTEGEQGAPSASSSSKKKEKKGDRAGEGAREEDRSGVVAGGGGEGGEMTTMMMLRTASTPPPGTAIVSRRSWVESLLGSTLSLTGGGGGRHGEGKGKSFLKLQQKRYGINRLPRRTLTSFWNLVLEAANDATLKILMLCGLLSIILALLFSKDPLIEAVEGFAIWVAVLVVVVVTATNDWLKEQQFAQLSVVKDDKKCTVIRNGGKQEQISVFDLVVGDLLQLEAGDEVPADALLIQARDMKVDESSLTGESDMIRKDIFRVCYDEALKHIQQHQTSSSSSSSSPSPPPPAAGHPPSDGLGSHGEGGEQGRRPGEERGADRGYTNARSHEATDLLRIEEGRGVGRGGEQEEEQQQQRGGG